MLHRPCFFLKAYYFFIFLGGNISKYIKANFSHMIKKNKKNKKEKLKYFYPKYQADSCPYFGR